MNASEYVSPQVRRNAIRDLLGSSRVGNPERWLDGKVVSEALERMGYGYPKGIKTPAHLRASSDMGSIFADDQKAGFGNVDRRKEGSSYVYRACTDSWNTVGGYLPQSVIEDALRRLKER